MEQSSVVFAQSVKILTIKFSMADLYDIKNLQYVLINIQQQETDNMASGRKGGELGRSLLCSTNPFIVPSQNILWHFPKQLQGSSAPKIAGTFVISQQCKQFWSNLENVDKL